MLKTKLANSEKDLDKERTYRSEMIGHQNPNNKVKLLEKYKKDYNDVINKYNEEQALRLKAEAKVKEGDKSTS